MENKVCKVCKRPLPEDSKHILCENCRGKAIDKGKKAGAAFFTLIVGIGSFVSKVISEKDKKQ